MRTTHRFAAALLCAAVLATFVILMPQPALAQDGPAPDWNDPGDPLQGGVGLHYGRVGGHGLAFRLPLKWWLYLQMAGGLWHTSDRKQHNAGFELNYILRQDQKLRLYLAAGGAYFSDEQKTGTQNGQDVWSDDDHWNWGFGVGAEFLRGRRWSLQIEGNFMKNGENDDITVVPQAGIYYYW